MDKAHQKLEQFRNQYKQNQGNLSDSLNKQSTSDSNISQSTEVLEKIKELENKVNQVSHQNNELKAKNSQLVKQQQDKSKLVQTQNDEKAMGDVLSGFTQKFSKDYSFPVLNHDPIKFKIVMKPMSAFDIAQVRNDTVDLTNARFQYYDHNTGLILESISAIKNLGEKYPDWLVDVEHLTRTDIPVVIYQDYLDWMDTFRKSSQR